jgi:8-oxo-dGTP pyrophosphatase MutT (NUDIX family)
MSPAKVPAMPSRPLLHATTEAQDHAAREPLTQVAALCTRSARGEGPTEVLLVTSRGTGRWILPKGWPIDGRSLAEAAAVEAWEEAGIRGRPEPQPIGSYAAEKVFCNGTGQPCRIHVFRLTVEDVAETYPEAAQRRRIWVPAAEAAQLVREPELGELLRRL